LEVSDHRFIAAPHFKLGPQLKDSLYRKYFQDLEGEILRQWQWAPGAEGITLRLTTRRLYEYAGSLTAEQVDEIVGQLIMLPGYFASRRYEWNHVNLREYIEMSREAGTDMNREYLIPGLKNTEQSILFLNETSAREMGEEVPTGIASEKTGSANPFIHGFFKYTLNHLEVGIGSAVDF
ncbi:MAG: hypothetical protein GY765_39530, partial [bacterium]|nr:hypothetical protein [bacterium]